MRPYMNKYFEEIVKSLELNCGGDGGQVQEV